MTYSMNKNMNIVIDILCHKYENLLNYLLTNSMNIQQYLNLLEYLKIIKTQAIATYQS